jgi:hypothetical protein
MEWSPDHNCIAFFPASDAAVSPLVSNEIVARTVTFWAAGRFS